MGRGQAAVTTGGALQAAHVVHVVGPRYQEGQDNEGSLRDAVRAALDAAASIGDRSIAFPAISAGIFGYPPAEATAVVAAAVVLWLEEHQGDLDEVRLVALDAGTARAFGAALRDSPAPT